MEQIRTDKPGRRIDLHRIIADDYRCFITRQPGVLIGKPDVCMIVDCSGSMNGEPAAAGRHLIGVLSELTRRGRINGHVILSKASGRGDTFCCQRFKLPMRPDDIARIPADGSAERLESSIRINEDLVRTSDITVIYTDGDITDSPIDKSGLHRKGIFTYGLYVGDITSIKSLNRYVDCPIQAPSFSLLVDRFAVKLKAHMAKRAERKSRSS
jgi:hypothetical protein